MDPNTCRIHEVVITKLFNKLKKKGWLEVVCDMEPRINETLFPGNIQLLNYVNEILGFFAVLNAYCHTYSQ